MKYLLLFSFLLPLCLFSQDKIFKINGTSITCHIVEVNTAEIHYRKLDSSLLVEYVIDKESIDHIVFADGHIEKYIMDKKMPVNYKGQKRRAIKIDLLSPLQGYCHFSYENVVHDEKSIELSLGIIGLGTIGTIDYSNNNLPQQTKKNQLGFFGGVGFKFNKITDFMFGGPVGGPSHIMQGLYAKPIIYFGSYKENRVDIQQGNNQVVVRPDIMFAALQVEFGKQWVIGDFLTDVYFGMGYGIDNKNYSPTGLADDTSAFNYANSRLGKSPGVSFSFGLKVGGLY